MDPFNNGFYLSGGGFYNGNKAKFKISPKNGKLTVMDTNTQQMNLVI